MKYEINPAVFGSLYSLPADIADKHLKLANITQLKVILYLFRHLSELPDSEAIAVALRADKGEVEDALTYWAANGIISIKDSAPIIAAEPAKKPKTVKTRILPTREEIGRSAAENPVFRDLLTQAQEKFGRLLKQSETSTLLWLLEDEGMNIAVILMLLEYAASEGRLNITFIERTATEWINAGVTDVRSAEAHIKETYRKKIAWKAVEKAFGIDDRLPSTKELEYAEAWITDWKFDDKMLKLAYDKCVDKNSKLVMSYVAKILESYHKKGYKTAADAIAGETKPTSTKNNISTHDVDMIEQMISKGYGEK